MWVPAINGCVIVSAQLTWIQIPPRMVPFNLAFCHTLYCHLHRRHET